MTSSSTTDRSITLAQTTQRSPIVESKICEPVAIRVRSPTDVGPRRTTLGSRITSCGELHRVVEVDGRRVEHRHPGPHPAVVELHPHVPLGAGELGAVVDPGRGARRRPCRARRRCRPSSRAKATRSVRYSSPVAGDGRGRRSGAAATPRRSRTGPALISAIWRSSSVASLSSTIRSTVPPSLRTTRPSPVGSTASTETRAIAAWSRPRSSSSVDSISALDERDVAREDEHLLDAVREHLEGGPQRVARAPGLVLEAPCPRGPRRRSAPRRSPANRRRAAARRSRRVAASST